MAAWPFIEKKGFMLPLLPITFPYFTSMRRVLILPTKNASILKRAIESSLFTRYVDPKVVMSSAETGDNLVGLRPCEFSSENNIEN